MSNSDSPIAEPLEKPAAKPRSPVERAVVWGVIGVLLVVLGIELTAFGRYQYAFWRLSQALEAGADDPNGLTAAKVSDVLGGKKYAASEPLSFMVMLANRVEIYEWSGLFRTRRLYVYYGGGRDPEVVSILSHPKERVLGSFGPPEEAAENSTPAAGAE